ncbi:MAG: protein phosphatase 2C domain-containing protein [Acidobacteriota bacterium]
MESGQIITTVYGLTDTGIVRNNNEDALLISDPFSGVSYEQSAYQIRSLQTNQLLLIVSDGMGGAQAGERASALTVETIKTELSSLPPTIPAHERLSLAVQQANRAVYLESLLDPSLKGMGATVTAVLVIQNMAFVAEVGDSRAYILRGKRIKQITTDQSFVEMMIAKGVMTSQDAYANQSRNVILQAIGMPNDLQVAMTAIKLQIGDRILLCSDGLSNKMMAEEMFVICSRSATIAAACEKLVTLAKRRGGEDNITVIMAAFDGDGLTSSSAFQITDALKTITIFDPSVLLSRPAMDSENGIEIDVDEPTLEITSGSISAIYGESAGEIENGEKYLQSEEESKTDPIPKTISTPGMERQPSTAGLNPETFSTANLLTDQEPITTNLKANRPSTSRLSYSNTLPTTTHLQKLEEEIVTADLPADGSAPSITLPDLQYPLTDDSANVTLLPSTSLTSTIEIPRTVPLPNTVEQPLSSAILPSTVELPPELQTQLPNPSLQLTPQSLSTPPSEATLLAAVQPQSTTDDLFTANISPPTANTDDLFNINLATTFPQMPPAKTEEDTSALSKPAPRQTPVPPKVELPAPALAKEELPPPPPPKARRLPTTDLSSTIRAAKTSNLPPSWLSNSSTEPIPATIPADVPPPPPPISPPSISVEPLSPVPSSLPTPSTPALLSATPMPPQATVTTNLNNLADEERMLKIGMGDLPLTIDRTPRFPAWVSGLALVLIVLIMVIGGGIYLSKQRTELPISTTPATPPSATSSSSAPSQNRSQSTPTQQNQTIPTPASNSDTNTPTNTSDDSPVQIIPQLTPTPTPVPDPAPTSNSGKPLNETNSPSINPSNAESGTAEQALREVLNRWQQAHNKRNVSELFPLYASSVDRYYLRSNLRCNTIFDDKRRYFRQYKTLTISIDDNPEIILGLGGRTATITFDKSFTAIGTTTQNGKVRTELTFAKIDNEWRITSERDLKIYNLK